MKTAETLNVGIWGLGTYLPPVVRTNDWWPSSVVDRWRRSDDQLQPKRAEEELEGPRGLVRRAMDSVRSDPFYGSVQRRILDDGLEASFMEVEAARRALADAQVAAQEVDLLLQYATVPDYLASPTACRLHHDLEVAPSCLAMTADSGCNSFMHQLCLAEAMIRAGKARVALLVQSNLLRRIIDPTTAPSAWFGDGATAVVVGRVGADRGILGTSHRVNGETQAALVASVPGKRWYDDGPIWWHARDRAAGSIIFGVLEQSKEVVHEALERAGILPSEVDFYASHQATPWFRPLTQEYLGLDRARHMDTFQMAGHLSACNVPISLEAGKREGLLRDGDLVAMYSGGSGLTWSGVVLRWGRGE